MLSSVNLRQKLFQISETLHLRIFGHEMGSEMQIFLKNLSWSFFGSFFSGVLLLVAGIIAGKVLGPQQFGEYNSILSLAMTLSALFLLGIDMTSIRFLSDLDYKKSAGAIIIISFFLTCVLGIIISGLFFILNSTFGFSQHYLWIVALAFLVALKNLVNGYLRSFSLIKYQSAFKLVDALLVFCLLIGGLVFFKGYSYSFYLTAIVSGGIFFVVASFLLLRKGIVWSYQTGLISGLFKYNRFLFFMSLFSVGGFIDKFLIGKYVGIPELGYYSAYYLASHVIVAELLAMFMNVFWPSVIKNFSSAREIVRKINTVFLYFSWFFLLIIASIIVIFLSFFGDAYQINYTLVTLFSLSTFFGMVYSVYASFLNVNYMKYSMIMSIILYSLYPVSIIVFKSIEGYLLTQILLQAIATIFILHFFYKKTLCVV